MSGINGAVIAYGQTGTGKTFTMIGIGNQSI
jgi:DNA replication protein DnaC